MLCHLVSWICVSSRALESSAVYAYRDSNSVSSRNLLYLTTLLCKEPSRTTFLDTDTRWAIKGVHPKEQVTQMHHQSLQSCPSQHIIIIILNQGVPTNWLFLPLVSHLGCLCTRLGSKHFQALNKELKLLSEVKIEAKGISSCTNHHLTFGFQCPPIKGTNSFIRSWSNNFHGSFPSSILLITNFPSNALHWIIGSINPNLSSWGGDIITFHTTLNLAFALDAPHKKLRKSLYTWEWTYLENKQDERIYHIFGHPCKDKIKYMFRRKSDSVS